MENNKVIQRLEENEQEAIEGVPVCGANFVSPVTHTTNFIEEIRYKMGTRLYRKCRLEIKGKNKRTK
jgi:hypothetical protein